MNDVLPEQIGGWQHLEDNVRKLLTEYGFEEIRTPIVENTALFKRAIGEFTDVVEKEMYTFTDQGGDSLTLRPEATAGIMRAAIENGMLRGARHKLWCIGPMFRREKPQKGRYRQFYQVDVEALGFTGPDIDAELIAMTARLWRKLGIERGAAPIPPATPHAAPRPPAAVSKAIRCAFWTARIRKCGTSLPAPRC